MPEVGLDLAATVERVLELIDGPLVVGAPLGLGEPHRLLNALYDRVAREPSRQLLLRTALSLDVPEGASELERRFLAPSVAPHFVAARHGDAPPANVPLVPRRRHPGTRA